VREVQLLNRAERQRVGAIDGGDATPIVGAESELASALFFQLLLFPGAQHILLRERFQPIVIGVRGAREHG
jgi:hypothetical protein